MPPASIACIATPRCLSLSIASSKVWSFAAHLKTAKHTLRGRPSVPSGSGVMIVPTFRPRTDQPVLLNYLRILNVHPSFFKATPHRCTCSKKPIVTLFMASVLEHRAGLQSRCDEAEVAWMTATVPQLGHKSKFQLVFHPASSLNPIVQKVAVVDVNLMFH